MGSRLCGGRPMQRFRLRDEQWERIKDLLPGREGHVLGNAADNRLLVDAVLYRYRTGVPWRDLPARFAIGTSYTSALTDGRRAAFSIAFSSRWRATPTTNTCYSTPLSCALTSTVLA